MLAHVAGLPVEEALPAAPALLAGVTLVAGYVRAAVARPRRRIRRRGGRTAGAVASPRRE